MATGGSPFPIWDRRNVDQQELVDNTPCKRLLEKAGVVLQRNLRTEDVLPHLQQLDVLDRVDVEHITHDAPRPIIVDRLVAFLQTCVMWQLHGLLRACALTGQSGLIREVGLNPGDYITEEKEAKRASSTTTGPQQAKAPQHPGPSSTIPPSQKQTMPAQLLQAIVYHCRNCKRCLMRRNLYDVGNKDAVKVIDTTTCYIKVNPLREGEQGKMTEITEKDILLALPGEEHPHVIRLEGQPGVGKTALAHHIVYDWSVEFLRRVGEVIPIEIGGHLLTTIVHIPARSITTTVEDAIYDNLRCPKEYKPILADHVKKGNGTTIELDGIDEIRNKEVLQNVKTYVKERQMGGDGPQVLLTARTDLCSIDLQDIDRFITVKGFSVSQGFSYIKAYLQDNLELCQKVLNYVHAHQQRLYAILTNPLRLHIFCALVSEGELQLDDNDDLCILKLFTLLEKCLLRREGKEVTEVELHNFYRMCLYGLLNGLREFSEELLKKFKIAEACHIFFAKKDVTTVLDKHPSYSFPHEMMFEFFAGRYIETLSLDSKKALLLSVCCKAELRNLQRIIFEVILQQQLHQEELLLLMLRSILLLQHDHKVGIFQTLKRYFSGQTLFNELARMKTELQAPKSSDDLVLKDQRPKKVKRTNHICDKVNSAFNDSSDVLQKMNWYAGLGNGVFGHVSECLNACSPEQRVNLSSKSTERLLPYVYKDKEGTLHMVHTVGLSRWAEVRRQQPQYSGLLSVCAWCPGDVQEVLYKVRRSGYTTPCTWLSVDLTTYQDTWGQADTTAFCTQVWDELYQELTQWEQGFTDCILTLPPSTPLQGLLQSEAGHLLYRVHHGTIDILQLQQVLTAAHLPYTQRCARGEDCTLQDTTIVIPAGGDQAALSRMKDDILSKGRPRLRKPRFVKETGEEYHWT